MEDLSLFQQTLSRFATGQILCIGDVMIDHFVYGQVRRVSPEAPVPILRSVRQSTVLGGAGNVARNLSKLGATCFFCSVVGEDDAANEVHRLFGDLAGGEAFLVGEQGRQTTTKTRYVSEGQQLLRVDEEECYPVSRTTQEALLDRAKALIPKVDAVILSDYGKGLLTEALIQGVMREATLHGKPVIVDPKRPDFSVYAGATLITPNTKELEEATFSPLKTDEDLEKALASLLDLWDIRAVLATRGAKGMTLKDAHSITHIPTQALEIYDVSGAGDTVVATAALALGVGADLTTAAKLANIAAGLVVAKAGTATVSSKELQAALSPSDRTTAGDKRASWASAQEEVIEWHRRGLKVGLANGCYDLLHPGHVSLLTQAKRACDRLIVALNTDASVQRLKGPSRPLQNEESRAQVMAALEDVDLVILFDQDTPLDLIQHLRPDVLIKGADYKIEDVVGAQEVLSWGGDVLLASLEEGHSTSHTIAKMTA